MNNENLMKMADYLDGEIKGQFGMIGFCDCVIGHAMRVFENQAKYDYLRVPGASQRIFGISDAERNDPTWLFCFGSTWSNNPHLAAVRLRYVAAHGSAPSRDQWPRFETEQKPVQAEEVKAEKASKAPVIVSTKSHRTKEISAPETRPISLTTATTKETI